MWRMFAAVSFDQRPQEIPSPGLSMPAGAPEVIDCILSCDGYPSESSVDESALLIANHLSGKKSGAGIAVSED